MTVGTGARYPIHALAFNALTEALGEQGQWIPLSAREAVAAAVEAAIEVPLRALTAEEIACAIEQALCEPAENCADRFCPDCIRYRQAQRDAAAARRIGGAR